MNKAYSLKFGLFHLCVQSSLSLSLFVVDLNSLDSLADLENFDSLDLTLPKQKKSGPVAGRGRRDSKKSIFPVLRDNSVLSVEKVSRPFPMGR